MSDHDRLERAPKASFCIIPAGTAGSKVRSGNPRRSLGGRFLVDARRQIEEGQGEP